MKKQKPIQFSTIGSKTWVKEFREALKNPNFTYTKPENIEEPIRIYYSNKTDYENALRVFVVLSSL